MYNVYYTIVHIIVHKLHAIYKKNENLLVLKLENNHFVCGFKIDLNVKQFEH